MNLRFPLLAGLAAAALLWSAPQGVAANAKDTAAIRACAAKYAENVDEAERRCIFALVADPCTEKPAGQTTLGTAECYRAEQEIWDALLNENFRSLRDGLDEGQKTKLRDMQRAWIAYRDTTCAFYHDKIQGTMANMMQAACVARESARRAMLLDFFRGL